MMRYRILDTPTGPFAVMRSGGGGVRTSWLDGDGTGILEGGVADEGLLPDLVGRLARYFDGLPVDFGDVRLEPARDFTTRCWEACRRIPRGRTLTYGELANRAGSPTAARAAGQAMRHNPHPIIVPCHRVVASGGRLGGFAGSCDGAGPSLARKRLLLQLEGADPGRKRSSAADRSARPLHSSGRS